MDDIARRMTPMLEHARLPSPARDAADLALLRALPKPDAETRLWTVRYSEHGATDMWVQLARGLGERGGPEQARLATDLLRVVRDAGRLLRVRGDQLFDRPRPFMRDPSLEATVWKSATSSFPSGHSLAAYASARVMATVDPSNARTYWQLAREQAAARVVGRVHHPSDVAAGVRIGARLGSEVLAAFGMVAAAAPPAAPFLRSTAYARVGDPALAARVVSLMPHDVRAAGPGTAAIHAWFGRRSHDARLVF